MTDIRHVLSELQKLDTERPNPHSAKIDQLSPNDIAKTINTEDQTVALVVARALPVIVKTAEAYAATLRSGGRIFYLGAGTSGRLGVLDAAECPPTFGTEPWQIIGLIAGGHEAMVRAMEGVEDNESAAIEQLSAHNFNAKDFLIGIAASRRTPFTLAGLRYAKEIGAKTAFIICNSATDATSVDFLIELPVGPEVITGSTRMKSGTAQKLALNTISTTAMVLLGKTYGNLMVDLQSKSAKLAARSRKILIELLGISIDEAERLLQQSGGSVKIAIVMHKFHCDKPTAITRLAKAGGFISRIS